MPDPSDPADTPPRPSPPPPDDDDQDQVEEDSKQSFPASDPPSNY